MLLEVQLRRLVFLLLLVLLVLMHSGGGRNHLGHRVAASQGLLMTMILSGKVGHLSNTNRSHD
jgi:hypothetical protein